MSGTNAPCMTSVWCDFTHSLEPILQKNAKKGKARALPARKKGVIFVLIFGIILDKTLAFYSIL